MTYVNNSHNSHNGRTQDAEDAAKRAFFETELENAVIDLTHIDAVQMPPRNIILWPWLYDKQINVIHAPKGAGKTWFALSIAVAITHNKNIGDRWIVKQPSGVLYIDGEVAFQELRGRIKALAKGHKRVAPFGIISNDEMSNNHNGAYINLSDKPIREAVRDYLELHPEYRVIFLDNKAMLCPGGDENSKSDYDAFNQWVQSLQRSGLTIIIVHHSNKTGGMRGTSAVADNPEYIFALKDIPVVSRKEGMTSSVFFEKSRNVFGPDADKFIFKIRSTHLDKEKMMLDNAEWSIEVPKGVSVKQKVLQMLSDGMEPTEIAKELKVNVSTVYRHKKEGE